MSDVKDYTATELADIWQYDYHVCDVEDREGLLRDADEVITKQREAIRRFRKELERERTLMSIRAPIHYLRDVKARALVVDAPDKPILTNESPCGCSDQTVCEEHYPERQRRMSELKALGTSKARTGESEMDN